jgi:hypothetical protein
VVSRIRKHGSKSTNTSKGQRNSPFVHISPAFHYTMQWHMHTCTLTQIVATCAIATMSTSSGGSAESSSSTHNTRPRDVASVASSLVADPTHMSTRIHDAHALHGTSPAPLQGTSSLPDASQCVLADVRVSPEFLTRVALQARLRESISHRELECERNRANALENLVHQLATELSIARRVIARQADIDRS